MALEPTNVERRAVIDAIAFAVGKVPVLAKGDLPLEQIAACLPLVVDVAWPLIRDMVLDRAHAAIDARWNDGLSAGQTSGLGLAVEAVRALKGDG